MSKKTADKLKDVDRVLLITKNSLGDLKDKDPNKRISGIYNVAVWGRSVTNVLQNLRSVEPEFNSWYDPYAQEMKNDPLMRFFYELRSEVLKEGTTEFGTSTIINNLSPQSFARIERPPFETEGFFMGDEIGGSGWDIKLPDGSTEKYYVAIPPDIGGSYINFSNPPTSHLGKDCSGKSIYELCQMYVEYLESMVKDAKKRFS